MAAHVTQTDIENGLRELGLGDGDIVLVHSSLSSLGHVEGGAETVVEAILRVLGPSGTLVVPTFGSFGVITDVVKDLPHAVHSIHPKASVAAVGAQAEALCRDHWKAETAHGTDTPYVRIADLAGYVCLLGVDQDRNTTLHAVEELLRLPYLKPTDRFAFETPEGEVTMSWPHFPGPHRDFIGLDADLRRRGIVKLGRVGDAAVRLMKSQETIDYLLEVGRSNPAFALCENPNCADCVGQRSDLRRDRFGREPFRVVASARLAGDWVSEILASCGAAGIDAVELDGLAGRPVDALPTDEVQQAVEALRDGGCEVAALRASASGGRSRDLILTAAGCEVERVVFPLGVDSNTLSVEAQEAGLSVSFVNLAMGGGKVFDMMEEVRAVNPDAGLTFSATGFVSVGEKPFLQSYGSKLKRFVDQLDVEDRTFSGEATTLAGGNAEIKELVSILRCSHFSGTMLLGAGNREAGDLRQAAERFERMLREL
ncbi:MAG: AAC(3) family N-acetyltransferase [Candidatus Latescibacteria bacterium]|jgi:aminoglycoside 3-N-acetyltransferase|nr:AAC(3) family N-acetyltransferase [Candidatus Latescibacterota bacterium]